jgi:hypothetical protein
MNGHRKGGSFTSSSAMLDKIYDGFVNTYEGLTVSGMVVDCTNRGKALSKAFSTSLDTCLTLRGRGRAPTNAAPRLSYLLASLSYTITSLS